MTTSVEQPPPPTRSGLLSNARHLVLPAGIVSSAFPSIYAVLLTLRLLLDSWQAELAKCILAKDQFGLYAADTIVISICRQAGKTFLIGCLVFADCIKNPGSTTVWTAHRFKVSRETFNELRALAKSPLLAPHIDYDAITTAAGNECIPFRNGSRILFAARERGAIRGFTKVRRLILDEAQILTESAMSDLVPTTNQAENPQIILMGTPPKPSDPGEVFTSLREQALEGSAEGLLYVEFSADLECDSDDWAAVAEANPSYPVRTGKRAILRLRKLLTNDDDYRREGLGIWDDTQGRKSKVDMAQWAKLADRTAAVDGPVALAVAIPRDRSSSTVSVSWLHGDRVFSAVTRLPGTSKAVELIRRKRDEYRVLDVSLHAGGPAGSLVADLEAEGIEVTTVSTQQFAQATGDYRDGIASGEVGHVDQAELTDALRVARLRNAGDGEMWDQRDELTDVAPVVAVTLSTQGFVKHAPANYDLMESFW